jgi:hypothetical protein
VRASPRNRKVQFGVFAPNDEVFATASRLTGGGETLNSGVMLQHNSSEAGKKAHLAHAAVMSLHAICCGLPALAMLAVALSGAASGVALFADYVGEMHRFLHGHEYWILAVSAGLVGVGGWMELQSRRHHNHGFPWLFAFSVLCFFANVTMILVHRAT